jgi:trimeric autotransporter adhesin
LLNKLSYTMLKLSYCFLLAALFLAVEVIAETSPVASGVNSETCRNTHIYTLHSPSPTLTYTSADLEWGSFAGQPGVVRYRKKGISGWTVVSRYRISSDIIRNLLLNDLTINTTYEWQVATLCAPNDTSEYTSLLSFTTAPCTNSAALLTTANISSNSATVDWRSNAAFIFQWRAVNAPDWITINPAPTRPYTFTGLTNQTAYEWRVAEICTATQTSTYVAPESFTTSCPVPVNLRSADNFFITDGKTLTWESPLPGLTVDLQYQVQGSDTPDNWTTVSNVSGTAYTISLPFGAYNWRIRSVCEPGVFSEYTAPQTFSVTCRPIEPQTIPAPAVTTYSISVPVIWDNSDLAYNVQWRATGAERWTTIPNNGSPTFVLTGLRSNQAYDIRTQRVCSPTLSSPYSAIYSFTTVCPKMSYGSPYAFPTGYIQLGDMPDPATVGSVVEWRGASEVEWQSSPVLNGVFRYQIPNLTPGQYEFRAKIICVDGSESAYTPVKGFNFSYCTESPYGINGYAYCIGAEEVKVDFQTCGDERNQYEIRWRKTGTDCWLSASVTDSLNRFDTDYDRPGRQYVIKNLQPATAYEWQIITRKTSVPEELIYGQFSSFTTAKGIPDHLVLLCAGNQSATVSWNGYDYANNIPSGDPFCSNSSQHSQLQYRVIGETTWSSPISYSANEAFNARYSFTRLLANTAYEWRVRRILNSGIAGAYSAPATFTTTGCLRPTVVQYFSYFRDCTKAVIAWGSCPFEQARYEIRYRAVGSTPWTTTAINSEGIFYSQVTYTLSGLLQRPYEVQVRSLCVSGAVTEYSSSLTVVVGCPERLSCSRTKNLCHLNITSRSALLKWEGTGPFELRWRKGYASAWNTVQVPIDLNTITGSSSYYLTDLEPYTPYDWQVRCVCSTESGFSAVDFFRTVCKAPLYGRAAGIAPTSAKLTWSNADNSLTYKLFWRKSGEPNWQVITGITTPFYSLTGLTRSTEYQWRVETECGASAVAVAGPVRLFRTTATVAAVSTTLSTISNGNWNDPSTWACNRIPVSTDTVTIGHIITIPPGVIGVAQTLSHTANGKIIYGTGGKLNLGF